MAFCQAFHIKVHISGGSFQTLLVILLSIVIYRYARRNSEEKPVKFVCNPPESLQKSHYALLETVEEPEIASASDTAIYCYAPASGKRLGKVQPITRNGIDRAVNKARAAQKHWKETPWKLRRKVLSTMLKHILENQEGIAHAACVDSGKVRVDASFGEILATCEKISWTIKNAEKALKTERRENNLLMLYKRNEVRCEPLGVVAALVSWNYPFHNIIHLIVSALATGNGILVKPSERTCISAQYFISLAQQAILVCMPGRKDLVDLIQYVPCWPSEAAFLTSHPAISHITFIGSREVAHHVASSAARSLTALTLELGGKDPAIILDNTPRSDLQRIASILMRGVFQAAGQNCIGIERIIVQPSHLAPLLAILEPRVRAIRVGDALDAQHTDEVDMGACISGGRFEELETLIADAVKQGAVLHVGGRRFDHPRYPKGHYFQPTLLSEVTPDMQIARTELFAPVMVILSVSCTRTIEEVLDVANGTPYALGASVFGKRNSKELEYVTQHLRAGMVSLNDFASYYLCSLPFGGSPSEHSGSGSGYGRFGGKEGLRALCNLKSVNKDKWPRWITTSIPPRLDYRKGDDHLTETQGVEAKKWAFASGIVALGFGFGVRDLLEGLSKVIWNG